MHGQGTVHVLMILLLGLPREAPIAARCRGVTREASGQVLITWVAHCCCDWSSLS